jgi:hypothetical protein
MESLYGKSDRVWIMDRGMASEDNLELFADIVLPTRDGQEL